MDTNRLTKTTKGPKEEEPRLVVTVTFSNGNRSIRPSFILPVGMELRQVLNASRLSLEELRGGTWTFSNVEVREARHDE